MKAFASFRICITKINIFTKSCSRKDTARVYLADVLSHMYLTLQNIWPGLYRHFAVDLID